MGGGVSRGERHKGETVVATEVAVTPEVDMVAAFVVFYSEYITLLLQQWCFGWKGIR